MAILGDFKLHIETETPKFAIESTSYPVEDGAALIDHIKRTPETLSIDGYIFGEYEETLHGLKKAMNSGEVLTYAGRYLFSSCIITSINPTISNIENGYKITIELKQVRFFKSPYKQKGYKKQAVLNKTTKQGKKQTTKRKKEEVYHKVRKGDTLWTIGKKYKTTVGALKKLNGLKDDVIHIGEKVRVK